MQLRSLGWEDRLEKSMAVHSSILAWRTPMDRGDWLDTVHSVSKSQTPLKQLSTQARMSIELVMPSNHLISVTPFLTALSLSSIRVFSNESALRIRCPKYWSFSLSISASNEYSGLISFRMDWFDLKSLFQHHSSKASILWHSAFFTVQLSHSYVTTGNSLD